MFPFSQKLIKYHSTRKAFLSKLRFVNETTVLISSHFVCLFFSFMKRYYEGELSYLISSDAQGHPQDKRKCRAGLVKVTFLSKVECISCSVEIEQLLRRNGMVVKRTIEIKKIKETILRRRKDRSE